MSPKKEDDKNQDVEDSKANEKSESVEDKGKSELEADFSELEELEAQIAEDDAESSKANDDKSKSDEESEEVNKKSDKNKDEESINLEKELSSLVEDEFKPRDNRSLKNEAAEWKRKYEESQAKLEKPQPPPCLSDEELAELVEKDYQGMGLDSFKANYKMLEDHYIQRVLPEWEKRQAKLFEQTKLRENIRKQDYYSILEKKIEVIKFNDPVCKKLEGHEQDEYAYTKALNAYMPQLLAKKEIQARKRVEEKHKLVPSDKQAAIKKIEAKDGLKLTKAEDEYRKQYTSLTDKDLSDPLLEDGKTIIDIDS